MNNVTNTVSVSLRAGGKILHYRHYRPSPMRSKSQHKKKGHTKELASMLRSLSFVKRASDKGEKVKSITLGLLPSPFGFTKELASMVCDSACRLGQAHTSNMLLFTYHFIFLHWHFVSPVTQLIQKFFKKNRQLIQKLPPAKAGHLGHVGFGRWIRETPTS